ncbi:hypothetical protein M422DRAFT_62446 [Sphaerobolus stellatus SS14]|uniref:NADP-dependent oxidoreductase domain-containing protein n=1 Tax=Sphaerobolus stellatus (strain SS14) TaxID=990650 RepID=A0A0C9U1Z2_SPHS4|nr:hypothetical protein M422DRAFT_62446 [Sphaerobolus stellatus SS14]
MSENSVEYCHLGNSGLCVSVPIPWVQEESKALPILKAAWDAGFNIFDTANIYSNDASEIIIGKFMITYKIRRDKLVIMAKCAGFASEDINQHPYLNTSYGDHRDTVNQGSLSRKAIFSSVEASLARLGTTYIDVLHPETPPEETERALHDLGVMGKVRYIGASTMITWQFVQLNHIADMQKDYSLLSREEERQMISYCNANGIGVISYYPLTSGDLARPLGTNTSRVAWINETPFAPKFSDADMQIIQRIEEIAKRHGWSMTTVALNWIAI